MKPVLTHEKEKKQIALHPKSAATFMDDINELMHKLEKRAYELFESGGRKDGRDLEDWFKAENELLKPVPTEINEKENRLVIRAEVPGFNADELEISLEPALLTIKGVQKQKTEKKEEKQLHSEIRKREIFRRIVLPVNVLPDDAEATLKDGVLEITVPKAAEAKKIHIAAA